MREWWIDEADFAGAEHLDASYVAGYDRKAQYDPSSDIDVLRAHGLGPGSSLVELGAGTGVFAAAAAHAGASVTAVDVAAPMVAALLRNAEDTRGSGQPLFGVVQAGFLTYEHDGPPADFVFCRNALHQLPDFWKVVALHRIAAMMASGAILRLRDLVFDVAPADVVSTMDAWLSFGGDDPAAGYTTAEFATHLKTEFSTFTWLLEPMLDQAGFDVVDRESRMGIYGAYTCRRRPSK